MTPIEERALGYLRAVLGTREIFVNPEGHEEGFFLQSKPTHGAPYLWKCAYLASDNYGHFLVDVTGDHDVIMKRLN